VKTRRIEMTESDIERFWSKVDKRGPDDCWEWNTRKFRNGYGRFMMRKVVFLAHRCSAALAGLDIDGLYVCHRCDNPACVNPRHLFVGTQDDNMQDARCKGRTARGGRLSKLSVRDVGAIYEDLVDGMTHEEVAKRHGTTEPTVRGIAHGRTWKHLMLCPIRRLEGHPPDLKNQVVQSYIAGEGSVRALATRFGVGYGTAHRWIAAARG